MLNSIKLKVLTLVILPVLLATLLITILTINLTYSNSSHTLEEFESSIVNEKKELLKNQILTIYTIIDSIIKESENIDEAKQKVINVVEKARFLNGSGYFFAYEKIGENYHFAFHGTKPQLNGTKTNIMAKDIKGFSFRKALIDTAKDDNKFVEYYYQKPNTKEILKKMAFSKYIKEFNWTIVTGIYVDDIQEKILKTKNRLDEDVNSLVYTLISMIIVLFIILVIVVSYISKISLIKPLEVFESGLLSFLSFLNKEKEDVQLIEITTKDEIGKMTKQINENITKIRQTIKQDDKVIEDVSKVVSSVSSGILTQQVEAKTSNVIINELTQNLNKMISNLHNTINHTIEVLKSYEKRDFTKQITISSKGELNDLSLGVNSLGKEISDMLQTNLDNSDILNKSSNDLSSNMKRLTISANEQAASLEESAAALEEITQTMRANSNNINDLDRKSVV